MYPSSMTDKQWAVLEPLLPPGRNRASGGGRPEAHPRRRILDAIFCINRGGVGWRMPPVEFPPWRTVYGFFTRWRDDGTWQRVHDGMRDRVRVALGARRPRRRRSSTHSRCVPRRPLAEVVVDLMVAGK